ncbi:MAG: threonine--tRNA ligase [Candidatus Jacksonbacteria bacterium]|jgi:threonyl-tRNA synthetase|nr:threonine--tRNA ligase [Candidatus Jacksonbacteria bacterium]MBT6034573.1 threonine--tRNA ligase [Candidatus Jacksonbacteria bacterium]MBT6301425.1 threonine--tRNA ligase [Candidatus Jacksonbacteria bacterium]MBT6756790.1 threonine--tRNA ligase [Candidatus Jacksonbacteria bacterium]MBT6955564.1 threonine--tRNA ligase [Candidatus Jacksonbacteria bacterium]
MKNIDIQRHSLAHIMAYAVQDIFKEKGLATFGVGPVIENGFYYDIKTPEPITDTDLKKIEKKMKHLIKQNHAFEKQDMLISDAIAKFEKMDQPYKVELLEDIKKHGTTVMNEIDATEEDKDTNAQTVNKVTLFSTGEFVDLCRGPHVDNTNQITASFSLTALAGAYWRGDENNDQLQRVYGVAFETKEALDEYLHMIEEAKKRDHKKLGRELDLFTFSKLVGSGLPLFTPKGTILREQLQNFVNSLRDKRDYSRVQIPHITKKDLYETSGHWEKFADELFRITTREGHEFAMKPMNCPHHTQIYDATKRSYKELPIRYSEATAVYRDEQSGELSGLSRVRGFTQDDSHIFCRMNHIEQEAFDVWDLINEFYTPFGMELQVRFSRHNPENFKAYLGTPEIWKKSEAQLKSLIEKRGVEYIDGVGEAAMYGPKIDFIAKDSLGREWQLATIQLDFNLPERFDLSCINEDNNDERIVMMHIAVMGSIERFMSILIEHFAGAFPLWLSPVQVSVLAVSEKFVDKAQEFANELRSAGIRVEVDDSNESVGKKIRNTEKAKTPYILVFGEKEATSDTLAVRSRGSSDTVELSRTDFISNLTKKISSQEKEL